MAQFVQISDYEIEKNGQKYPVWGLVSNFQLGALAPENVHCYFITEHGLGFTTGDKAKLIPVKLAETSMYNPSC